MYYFALGLLLKERYSVLYHCLFGDESRGSFPTEAVAKQCITDDQCVVGSGWIWMRPCDDVAPHGHSNGYWIGDFLYQFGTLLFSLQLSMEGSPSCTITRSK